MTGWEWNFRSRGAAAAAAALLMVTGTSLTAQQLSPAQVQELSSQVQAAGGRVIIQVKPTQGPRLQANGRSAMAEQALAAVQQRLQQQRGLRSASRVNLVPLVFGEVDASQLEALLNDPNVESVEPDVDMPLAEYRPGSFAEIALNNIMAESTPWGIDRVTAPAAWGLQSPALDGRGIRVAAMDSGGDINHPDLKFAGGYDATSNSTSPSAWNDDISVCNGHGTHVLGTIGALRNDIGVVGVAPGVDLYPLKVFRNSNGSCLASVSHQITALNWAVNQGIRVVSISIGGSTYVSSYEQAINAAMNAGTYVVAAAGNNGTNSLTYPGRYPNALAIGATTSSNTRASWSNHGPDLFAVAPGASIQSTMPGGGYGSKSGTSMATPHAAGVVALVLAANPGATRAQVLQRLQSGALDLGAAGWDDQFGHGLTRAFESINDGSALPPPPPPPVPLALAVSPGSRHASAVAGSTSSLATEASVSLTGDGSSTAGWTASKRKAWTTLITASGTGNGTARWSRNPTGLAVGTHVDTITVTSGSLTARVIDTLVITAAPVPLALSVSPGSRSASAVAGSSSAITDEASITLTGDGSSTAGWTASKRKAWTTLTTASGTGNGTVKWSRNPAGLAAGTHVDTITVTSGSLTARVIDTLVIAAAEPPPPPAVPLALAVSPGSRYASAVAGSTSSLATEASVSLTGDGSSTAGWTASKRKAWTTLTTASGTGNGTVKWSRNPAGLAAGTYVDTITVTSGSLTARVIDTLVITAAPAPEPLKLSVTPKGRKASTRAGTNEVLADSGDVLLTGTGASAATWTASRRSQWLTLHTVSGTGPGRIRWSRNSAGLTAGTYVDTITVASAGALESPTTIIDTLVITPHPGGGNGGGGGGGGGGNGGGTAKTKPANGKSTSVSNSTLQAVEIVLDSVEVYLDEENAPSFTWTASADQPWLQFVRGAGSDGEHVSWTRQTEALSPGLHVARITIKLQVEGAEFTVAFADSVISGVEDPAIVQAAEELFELSKLDTHQRRLLDQLGNRNGIYDVGDFLAWVERNSIAVPTDLMARVMSLPPAEPRAREPQTDDRKR